MFNSDELAEKVNSLSQSCVTDILEIGLAYFEAKEHLEESHYQDFLQKTKYAKNSSMIRKWYGIGKSYQRLSSVSEKLPPVFTTVYKIATITADELQLLISSGVLNPSVSTKEILDELHPKSKKQNLARIVVEFNDANCAFHLKELFDFIESNYSSFAKLKTNDVAKDLLDAANSKSFQLRKAA